MKTGRIATGLVIIAGALSAAIAYRHAHERAAEFVIAPLATPPGVTVQRVHVGPMVAGGIANGKMPVARTVFANAQRMPAYSFDKDTESGKSACVDTCAKDWPALLAAPSAKAKGDWSLIPRGQEGQQWAFKGKPLYVSAKDAPYGEPTGNGSADVWHVALFQPEDGVELPDGIEVRDLPKANGAGLVDDRGMSLYVFGDGSPDAHTRCEDTSCTYHWKPLAAAELARPTGLFTVVAGAGGSAQWAFRGQPLFSFEGDVEPGDATGDQPDKRWRTALVTRYFIPDGVTIRLNNFGGEALATDAGLAIYVRDRSGYMQGHSLRRGIPLVPAAGRQIGMLSCDAACAKNWSPLKAPTDALPSGFWDVATRADGTKQWVYMGYPLFLYSGDKKAGDMNGNDIYEFLPGQDLYKTANLPPIMPHGSAAFVWRQASP